MGVQRIVVIIQSIFVISRQILVKIGNSNRCRGIYAIRNQINSSKNID
jgi:hypothetical protein